MDVNFSIRKKTLPSAQLLRELATVLYKSSAILAMGEQLPESVPPKNMPIDPNEMQAFTVKEGIVKAEDVEGSVVIDPVSRQIIGAITDADSGRIQFIPVVKTAKPTTPTPETTANESLEKPLVLDDESRMLAEQQSTIADETFAKETVTELLEAEEVKHQIASDLHEKVTKDSSEAGNQHDQITPAVKSSAPDSKSFELPQSNEGSALATSENEALMALLLMGGSSSSMPSSSATTKNASSNDTNLFSSTITDDFAKRNSTVEKNEGGELAHANWIGKSSREPKKRSEADQERQRQEQLLQLIDHNLDRDPYCSLPVQELDFALLLYSGYDFASMPSLLRRDDVEHAREIVSHVDDAATNGEVPKGIKRGLDLYSWAFYQDKDLGLSRVLNLEAVNEQSMRVESDILRQKRASMTPLEYQRMQFAKLSTNKQYRNNLSKTPGNSSTLLIKKGNARIAGKLPNGSMILPSPGVQTVSARVTPAGNRNLASGYKNKYLITVPANATAGSTQPSPSQPQQRVQIQQQKSAPFNSSAGSPQNANIITSAPAASETNGISPPQRAQQIVQSQTKQLHGPPQIRTTIRPEMTGVVAKGRPPTKSATLASTITSPNTASAKHTVYSGGGLEMNGVHNGDASSKRMRPDAAAAVGK